VNAPARFDVSTGGELLGVLSASTTGPLEDVDLLVKGIGGAEVNVAIGLAGLGHTVTWWGAVGDDPLGRQGLGVLGGAGVDTSAVRVDADHPTGLYLKERPDALTALACYYRAGSAAAQLRVDDLDIDQVLDCRLLHVTGVTAALPGGAELLDQLTAAARQRKVTVSLDVNARPRLLAGRAAADVIGPLAANADIVLATAEEARAVFGTDDHRHLANRCRDGGPALIVVHDAESATAITSAGPAATRPAREGSVVDPVGAGDAFAGGFLSGILRGSTNAEALDLAHRCAVRVLGVLGDNHASPGGRRSTAPAAHSDAVGTVDDTYFRKGFT